jgi:hypothetical protein
VIEITDSSGHSELQREVPAFSPGKQQSDANVCIVAGVWGEEQDRNVRQALKAAGVP